MPLNFRSIFKRTKSAAEAAANHNYQPVSTQAVEITPAEDDSGNTPLHNVIIKAEPFSTVHLINIHLKNGANINAKNKDGNTPLHLALILSNEYIIEQLLIKGADITIKNNKGQTAIELAESKIDELKNNIDLSTHYPDSPNNNNDDSATIGVLLRNIGSAKGKPIQQTYVER